ncbi:ABC transporter ATP-binding protein [Kaustia mangrovi]|uniref:Glutathione import ATP-binding protein GsiA n=1 Tax=Kaustia mangrovi TaxID=2593653 RepID=A0A7S8HCC1_9HYPH|nr:ABC transporter ATP-binding protein [Kaustia mangrovi]QPC43557.1 ABC transporter ATP-binding protein [Kaustia mangrovi]
MTASGDIVLDVRGLSAEARSEEGGKVILDDVSFSVRAGETLCIAGESGSGKSITSLSLMRLLPGSVRVTGGEALLAGRDLLALSEREMRRVRGDEIAMIFQEPMTSLNPVMTVGRQLTEALRMHRDMPARAARARALEMLEAVRLSEPSRRLAQYPHELSGGMRQRVMIAMALSCNPKVLIADEPTTALDVTVQAQILSLMNDLKSEFGTAVVLITHDMGVVAEMADHVLVMNRGRVVETGDVFSIFSEPRDPYTRGLLAAVPRLGSLADRDGPRVRGAPRATPPAPAPEGAPVVSVRDLTVRFDIHGGLLQRPIRRVHAVEGISFDIRPGETLSLVGESGCGKSTTGKALLNLVPWSGAVEIAGHRTAGLDDRAMRPVRRDIQMIFQDPFASLDPRMTVGDLVAEPLVIHDLARGAEIDERVAWLFERVGLEPQHRTRHPHEFSGGQRQRICIARALSVGPKVIVADESVSALDVSVQAQVLELMQELQAELGIAYLFISHDMAVVEEVSHRVAVMYFGQIVEIGPRRAVFTDPCHAYTQRLLEAVPIADPRRRRGDLSSLSGEVPTPIRPLDFSPHHVTLNDRGGGHFAADAMPS